MAFHLIGLCMQHPPDICTGMDGLKQQQNAMDHMSSNHVQSLILKGGESENDQPNDNGTNAANKALYNNHKAEWNEQFVATQYTVPQMNTVI
eukprot:3932179-Ditylum_brightwellii.AAC.1